MADVLFDLPLDFYRSACVTDGRFDAEKAQALGYGPAQRSAIEEALALEEPEYDTGPLPEINAED